MQTKTVRSRKNTILLMIIVFFFTSRLWVNALAMGSEGYQLADNFINLLKSIDDTANKTRIDTAKTENDPNASDIEMTITAMKNAKLAINELERAKLSFNNLLSSKNEYIREGSTNISTIIDLLIGNYNDSVALLENLYSKENINNPDKVDLGKLMSRIATTQAERIETLKLFFDATPMLAYALTIDGPDNDGKLNYLNITSREREELKTTIERYFGTDVKDGPKAGQGYPLGAAATLYKFLLQPYKTLDKNK